MNETNNRVYNSTLSPGASTALTFAAATFPLTELIVQADPANTAVVLVGAAGSTPTLALGPGDSIRMDVKDPTKVAVLSRSGTQVANAFGQGG